MGDDLPSEYDVIIVGTGLTESIVAAAASRVGKQVLHLDSNSYYGGLWATFNFNGIREWIKVCRDSKHSSDNNVDLSKLSLNEESEFVEIKDLFSVISNIHEEWFVDIETLGNIIEPSSKSNPPKTNPELLENTEVNEDSTRDVAPSDEGPQKRTKEEEKEKELIWSRKFNLDLAPKLLYARGSLVELLISSNIARYAEFKCVTRVLTWFNSSLQPVPCSRADVFSTKNVSVVEKRLLMKLLTSFINSSESCEEFEGFQDKTFLDFLKSRKLPPNLVHYVLYAIAMGTEETSFKEGLSRSQIFLSSLGRYSNTPFLWPMFGSGELPQCFCRLSAVFGGIYHLQKGADELIISRDTKLCKGIKSNNQILSASHVVLGLNSFPKKFFSSPKIPGLSRGIFIIDKSIMMSDKEQLTLLQFPNEGSLVTVIEVGPAAFACPAGLYVVHMTCKQKKSAIEDLQPVANLLFRNKHLILTDEPNMGNSLNTTPTSEEKSDLSLDDDKPQLLWSLYFNVLDTSSCKLREDVPKNVYLCSGPDSDLDFEFSVQQAKSVFNQMYPDDEFLPRAPDPEEIVIEDSDPDSEDEKVKTNNEDPNTSEDTEGKINETVEESNEA